MRTNIARWGNSLAVRLPADAVRDAGLSEGAAVDVAITAGGALHVSPAHAFDKTAFLARLAKLHKAMPESAPVVTDLRRAARY